MARATEKGRKPSKLEDLGRVASVDGGEGGAIPIRLKINPRARRVMVRIDPVRGEAVAIAPSRRQAEAAVAFASERAGWIAAQLAGVSGPAPFAPGACVPVRGVMRVLRRSSGRGGAYFADEPELALCVPTPEGADFAQRVTRFLAAEARRDLQERAQAHAGALGVRFSRLTVKDTKSRWGSCTSAGVLSFSWRVILAPPEVLDYLAAHEVAHLREMNHSARFWRLVAQIAPHHARARAWLQRHGAGLHQFGVAAPTRAPL